MYTIKQESIIFYKIFNSNKKDIFAIYKYKGILMKQSVVKWLVAIICTVTIVLFQRMTGPTYPIRGKVNIEGEKIPFKLKRSHGGLTDHPVRVSLKNNSISGKVIWKRYKTNDTFTTIFMKKEKGKLVAYLPHQPPAGKLKYKVFLLCKGKEYSLSGKEYVVIRFKGSVPLYYLIPHILLMFLAIILNIRTGLEALLSNEKTIKLTLITLGLLVLGGMILGPIIQYFAFGEFWTGFPFGHDLTDNKTLIATIIWGFASWKIFKDKNKGKWWVLAATVITLAVYFIPHSMMGSELDYSKLPPTSPK